MNGNQKPDGVVYSTESGRMCPRCGEAVAACRCGRPAAVAPSDGTVRVYKETKGRQGKGVTVVQGVALDPVSLAQLGKQLRTLCGSGGTVKNGTIEVQGDHVERVVEHLNQRGMVARRVR